VVRGAEPERDRADPRSQTPRRVPDEPGPLLAGRPRDRTGGRGGPLEHCDGLALSGPTLYVAVNARNRVAIVDLADDGANGSVRTLLRSDAFAFPTAIAVRDEQLLIVNGQLDKMGAGPHLPFTVVTIPAGQE
jgi:hypothetical protein